MSAMTSPLTRLTYWRHNRFTVPMPIVDEAFGILELGMTA
jgi:hypothetical protein